MKEHINPFITLQNERKDVDKRYGSALLDANNPSNRSEASGGCATTEITLQNTALLAGYSVQVPVESGWTAISDCPYYARLDIVGKFNPEAVLFKNAPEGFTVDCGISSPLPTLKTVTCISSNVNTDRTIGDIALLGSAPEAGEGIIQLFDTQADATKLVQYVAAKKIAQSYLPIAQQNSVASAAGELVTVFQWEAGNDYTVIAPITVNSDTGGVQEPITTTQVLTQSIEPTMTTAPKIDVGTQ